MRESIATPQETVIQIQSKLTKFIRDEEATRYDIDLCIEGIRQLDKETNQIQETCFRINTCSLVIDNSLVQIQDANLREFDLSALIHVYRILDRPIESDTALSSNHQFLLIHQNPNLCLIGNEMNIVKQVLWTHDIIWDMCRSSSLNRFVIIEENNIFLADERTMSTEILRTNETKKWVSCGCSDTFLILSTRERSASIVKFGLRPSIATVEEWRSSRTYRKNERIESIASNNESFVVMIRNKLEK